MKRKKQEPGDINLLELIPERNLSWEKDEEGLVVLLKPKFRIAFLRRFLIPRSRSPYFKIKLDRIGSFFWECCDGKRRIKDIARLQQEEFGKSIEPVYDRISQFLRILERNRFIVLRRPGEPVSQPEP